MKKFLTLFFVCAYGFSFAQCESTPTTSDTGSSSISSASFAAAGTNVNRSGFADIMSNSNKVTIKSMSQYYATISGSPYLLGEEHLTADITRNDGTVIPNVPFKYDLYNENIIAINKKGQELLLNPKHFKEIKINHEGKITTLAKLDKNHPDQFMPVIHNGDGFTYFKKISISKREGLKNGVANIQDKFLSRIDYYISNSEGLTKLDYKKIKKISKSQSSEMLALQNYIDDNDLNIQLNQSDIASSNR